MKKLTKLIFTLALLIISFSCSDDEANDNNEQSEKTTITISKNIPNIKNLNFDITENLDILFKIESDNEQEINSDIFNVTFEETNSSIAINLEIKESYRNSFEISSGGSIFSTIFDRCNLSTELDQIGSTESDTNDMRSILCQNYNYDFNNSELITIPITFHLLEDSRLAKINTQSLEQRLNERISQTNSYFSQAKISFELKETNIFSVTHFQGYNILDQTRADEANMPYDENSLNVYVADFIGSSIDCVSRFQGIAQFPDSQIRTNRVFIEVWAFLDTIDPNGFLFSHELGHTFSLFHNFQNSPPGGFINCSVNTCLESDDTICDTLPADSDLDESLPCTDNRVKNLMSYSRGSHPNCNDYEFTYEQSKRMRFTAEYWYSNLFTENSQLSQSLNFYQYQGEVFETTESFSNPTFSQNGLHMYFVTDGKIAHYDLSSKYNLENLNIPQELETIANGSTRLAKDVIISSDGKTLFAKVKYVNFGNDLLLQYNLPIPYSLESAELVSQTEVFYAYNYFNLSTDDETLYLMRNPAPNQGIKIIGYRFGTPNDISTISANDEYSSPWIGYPNSFLPYVISKDGNSVLRSPVVGSSRILERYEVSEPWKLSTINSNAESELSHNFSDNGIVEFYDEEERVVFISTNEQGIYKLHKYER